MADVLVEGETIKAMRFESRTVRAGLRFAPARRAAGSGGSRGRLVVADDFFAPLPEGEFSAWE